MSVKFCHKDELQSQISSEGLLPILYIYQVSVIAQSQSWNSKKTKNKNKILVFASLFKFNLWSEESAFLDFRLLFVRFDSKAWQVI